MHYAGNRNERWTLQWSTAVICWWQERQERWTILLRTVLLSEHVTFVSHNRHKIALSFSTDSPASLRTLLADLQTISPENDNSAQTSNSREWARQLAHFCSGLLEQNVLLLEWCVSLLEAEDSILLRSALVCRGLTFVILLGKSFPYSL